MAQIHGEKNAVYRKQNRAVDPFLWQVKKSHPPCDVTFTCCLASPESAPEEERKKCPSPKHKSFPPFGRPSLPPTVRERRETRREKGEQKRKVTPPKKREDGGQIPFHAGKVGTMHGRVREKRRRNSTCFAWL